MKQQALQIRVQRVYDAAPSDSGARFLVDRLWPRGIKKEALRLDGWLKDLAPGPALRRWYGHDPAKWPEFRRRYLAELNRHPEALHPLLEAAARGPVTLLFAAKNTQQNNATVLAEYLARRLRQPASAKR